MTDRVSLDLMEFVEQQILPRYASFDKAHNMEHVTRVIRRSEALARQLGADLDMVYVIAAYHDLGLEGPRAIHHRTSGKILASDARLKKWFSPTQIRLMKEAVEDHRASASNAPRSIYGKIVAEADRDLDPEMVITRTIQFGLDHYPEYGRDEQWKRFQEHLDNKYSAHGYIRLWIPGSQNERHLKALRELINNPEALRKRFDEIFTTLTTTAKP
ncbi:MAG: HD domain-containing protein [Prevotella sp.]|nr:HD domain-containing protein [Prevotella sp.]